MLQQLVEQSSSADVLQRIRPKLESCRYTYWSDDILSLRSRSDIVTRRKTIEEMLERRLIRSPCSTFPLSW